MAQRLNLSRDQAFDARPVAARVVRRETLPGGGATLTVEQKPGGAYRWLLRMPETIQKKFELDAMGLEVLALCDGQKSVRHIVDRFAKDHGVNPHEARRAVVTFLQSMMRKGLVTMLVPRRKD